jgi:hypothetical protein
MPELSRFLGIVVAMYYRDHGPPLAELLLAWALAQDDKPLRKIRPLE